MSDDALIWLRCPLGLSVLSREGRRTQVDNGGTNEGYQVWSLLSSCTCPLLTFSKVSRRPVDRAPYRATATWRKNDQTNLFGLRSKPYTCLPLPRETPPQFVPTFDHGISRVLTCFTIDAYYTPETLDDLYTVDDIPLLRNIVVPDGWYNCARASRLRENSSRQNRRNSPDDATFVHHPYPTATITTYAAYAPYINDSASSHHPHVTSPPVYWGYSQIQTDFRFPPLPPAPPHRGVSLAPLDQLQAGRHQRRDPADEVLLRSFNSAR